MHTMTNETVGRSIPHRHGVQTGTQIATYPRWENYTPVGAVIPGTRILSFKVPLKAELSNQYPEDLRFTPECFVQLLRERNIDLGLVVDLTFTGRYYNPVVLAEAGIQHHKIMVPGKDVPGEQYVLRFYKVLDDFLEANPGKEKTVGVHCTHGVNRTGYLVCRYMIEKLGIPAAEAIEAYGKARGYPIERENYLEDLKTRSLKYKPRQKEARQITRVMATAPSMDSEINGASDSHSHSWQNHNAVQHRGRQRSDSFQHEGRQRSDGYHRNNQYSGQGRQHGDRSYNHVNHGRDGEGGYWGNRGYSGDGYGGFYGNGGYGWDCGGPRQYYGNDSWYGYGGGRNSSDHSFHSDRSYNMSSRRHYQENYSREDVVQSRQRNTRRGHNDSQLPSSTSYDSEVNRKGRKYQPYS